MLNLSANATSVANTNIATYVVINALNELHTNFVIDTHDKGVLMAEREAVKTSRDLELFINFAKHYEHGECRVEDWRLNKGCSAPLTLTQIREFCTPEFYARLDELPEETWEYISPENLTYDDVMGCWDRLEEMEVRAPIVDMLHDNPREVTDAEFYARADKLPHEAWNYLLGPEDDSLETMIDRWVRLIELENRHNVK